MSFIVHITFYSINGVTFLMTKNWKLDLLMHWGNILPIGNSAHISSLCLWMKSRDSGVNIVSLFEFTIIFWFLLSLSLTLIWVRDICVVQWKFKNNRLRKFIAYSLASYYLGRSYQIRNVMNKIKRFNC